MGAEHGYRPAAIHLVPDHGMLSKQDREAERRLASVDVSTIAGKRTTCARRAGGRILLQVAGMTHGAERSFR